MRVRLFGHHIHIGTVGIALLEMAICLLAPVMAIRVRLFDEIDADLYQDFRSGALVFSLSMIVGIAAMGLYSGQQRAQTGGTVLRLTGAASAAILAVVVSVYLFPGIVFGRGVLALSAVIALGGCFAVRLLFMHVVSEGALRRRVLVYGAGRRAEAFTQLRRRTDRRGFAVAGFVKAGDGPVFVSPCDVIYRDGRSLLDIVSAEGVSEVVVALDDRRRNFPVEDLLACRGRGINVIDIVSFLERETGKLRVDMLSPSGIIFSRGFHRDPLREGAERAFDIVASVLLLGLTWPIALLVMAAIKVEDGWRSPVLYAQDRVGLDGRLFLVLRFRSMREQGEPHGHPAWAAQRDARVTRVGRLLRKYRIDELPQLLNVLRGDMCFVGPRPEHPEVVDKFCESIPYYRERHRVKPGITGWAQLRYPYGASDRDAKERLQYDLYYLKHRSLVFDVMILLSTAEIVLCGRGVR